MKTLKSTIVFVIILLLIPITLNAQESTASLEFKNADSAQNLVQNYIMALQKGDVATMSAQLSEKAMIYGLGGGIDSLTVEQHKAYFTNSATDYTHSITQDLYLPVKVTNNWNEGEWVLAWGTNTITDKKTEIKTTIPYHTVNLIADGKIVMIRYFYDMSNIMKNTGWTLTPPKTE